jgi:hypothetical protein
VARVWSKRDRGVPADAVYVGRPTKWGNPFVIGQHGDRDEVIRLYRERLAGSPAMLRAVRELAGRDLVCWCSPEACHADVLVEFANRPH